MWERFKNWVTSYFKSYTCGYEYWPADFVWPEEVCEVRTTVIALIPEFELVRVSDEHENHYALRPSLGIDLSSLKEGDVVICTVTRHLPRVVSAYIPQALHQPE